jgi:Thermostable hemolysin
MYQCAVRELIADRYASVHGAVPSTDYPNFCVVEDKGVPRAVLGYRRASEGALFLEAYLDAPIEHIVSARLGYAVERAQIVEIGAHASSQSRSTLSLWARAAEALGQDNDIAVAVLTRDMRGMFERIGLAIEVMAPAAPARLPDEGTGWGRYYEAEPMVCMGAIAPARALLRRWNASEAR